MYLYTWEMSALPWPSNLRGKQTSKEITFWKNTYTYTYTYIYTQLYEYVDI